MDSNNNQLTDNSQLTEHKSDNGNERVEENDDLVISDEDPSFLLRPEIHKGRLIGDDRVRWELPRHSSFKRIGTGLLEATKVTQDPRTGLERAKRFLIGAPIASAQAEFERLTKFKALAVLSSDAISSVAYATEAILITLVAAGSVNLWVLIPISIAIVALLSIVVISYRQTIPAYPNGGGSYIVAKDNLGTYAGLIAAASLLIDYVLTVSVSISSGVNTLASLFTGLAPYIVLIDVLLVIIVTVVNLRGVRESGSVFAIPTYLFIGCALLLIAVGLIKSLLIQHHPILGEFHYVAANEPLTIFLILKSFAAGCAAMTGVEAISNGVPAFKKPETRNAAMTLTLMALILGTLFIGITLLATSYHIEANAVGNPTVLAQISNLVFNGPLAFMNPVFILSILFILTLAANTSYSDFPRLASLLARDHFLPHQFAFRGDRLAFSIGIIFLAVLAALLLVVFKGDTTQLINLYAVGVFLSFTLSQSGMVRHWWRLRKEHKGWQRSLMINGLGAVTTFTVAVVIAATKFFEGAWIVVVLIPLLVGMFLAISRHYNHVEHRRTTDIPVHPQDINHRLIVPIANLNTIAKQSLAYARSVSPHVTAVYVASEPSQTDALRIAWHEWQAGLSENEDIHLDVVELTHRSLIRSLLAYITSMEARYPEDTLTVILPESTRISRVGRLLDNTKVLQLKASLYFRPDIIVTNVSQQVSDNDIPLRPKDIKHRFIVPIAGLDRASIQSLAYARSISSHVIATHVAIDAQDVEEVRASWARLRKQLPKEEETHLVIIESPYRSLSRPLLAYIDAIQKLHPDDTLTVILPEYVVAHWWEHILHNQTALQLKTALLLRPNIVVTNIPQHLRERPHKEGAAA
ncbi:MAG: APC family permease [Ktedonobacteraceae bacterium]